MRRSILHCDMNNFYASVECVLNNDLKSKPLAVCGSVQDRHGIVLAKNELAKKKGVKTGDPIWMAKNKCKDIIILDKPHFEEYEKYSVLAKEIYKRYTDFIEPMGLDECWLDITNSLKFFGEPEKIAYEIKETIKKELGLTISVGVSFNKIFAKLGSDLKKPDAVSVITEENFREVVWPLPASSLLGVGRSTNKILKKYFINTIGDIAREKPERLEYLLGKNGIALYNYANGIDDDSVGHLDDIDEVKSISHGITTVKDLESYEEAWNVIFELTQEIALKLRLKKLRAKGIAVSVRDADLLWQRFQVSLDSSEQSALNIAKVAFELFKSRYDIENPVRSISVAAINLIDEGTPEQISIFDDHVKKGKIEKAEKCMDELNFKFGEEIVKNASLYKKMYIPDSRRKVKYDTKKKN